LVAEVGRLPEARNAIVSADPAGTLPSNAIVRVQILPKLYRVPLPGSSLPIHIFLKDSCGFLRHPCGMEMPSHAFVPAPGQFMATVRIY
jgi:hypothetical protein